jgi:hypothetical protein
MAVYMSCLSWIYGSPLLLTELIRPQHAFSLPLIIELIQFCADRGPAHRPSCTAVQRETCLLNIVRRPFERRVFIGARLSRHWPSERFEQLLGEWLGGSVVTDKRHRSWSAVLFTGGTTIRIGAAAMAAGPSAMEVDGAGPLDAAVRKAASASSSYELPWVRFFALASPYRAVARADRATSSVAALNLTFRAYTADMSRWRRFTLQIRVTSGLQLTDAGSFWRWCSATPCVVEY